MATRVAVLWGVGRGAGLASPGLGWLRLSAVGRQERVPKRVLRVWFTGDKRVSPKFSIIHVCDGKPSQWGIERPRTVERVHQVALGPLGLCVALRTGKFLQRMLFTPIINGR